MTDQVWRGMPAKHAWPFFYFLQRKGIAAIQQYKRGGHLLADVMIGPGASVHRLRRDIPELKDD